MPISLKCFWCAARLQIPRKFAGTTVTCPKCKRRVLVRPETEAQTTQGETTGGNADPVEKKDLPVAAQKSPPNWLETLASAKEPNPTEPQDRPSSTEPRYSKIWLIGFVSLVAVATVTVGPTIFILGQKNPDKGKPVAEVKVTDKKEQAEKQEPAPKKKQPEVERWDPKKVGAEPVQSVLEVRLQKLDREAMELFRKGKKNEGERKIMEALDYLSKSFPPRCTPTESLAVAVLYVRIVALTGKSLPKQKAMDYITEAQSYSKEGGIDPRSFDQWFEVLLTETVRACELSTPPTKNGEKKGTEPSPPKAGDIITNDLGMKFAWIPSGNIKVGPKKQFANPIKGFYMSIHAVTQSQWKGVMGTNPSHFKGDDRPVEKVSWNDCVAFCKKLSDREGTEYRLPTEREWEYACRAGSQTAYYFGDDSRLLGDYAWFTRNAEKKTHPVGQKRANAWGLFDMHGNVWQWCGNFYDKGSSDRVIRGGGWFSLAEDCTVSSRSTRASGSSNNDVGFRLLALPIDE